MKTIIILCYGVTFLSAASSLKCKNCMAAKAATCSGTEVTCDSSVTSCISSLTEISYESATIQIPQKLCGIPGFCNFSYSMTLNDTHIASAIQCCTSDNCNTDLPQIAPRNLTKNGLKCPYCVEPGLGGCTAAHHMLCTGLETKCIDFSGNMDLGDSPVDVSYQGCATQSACPANPVSVGDTNSDIRSSCTNALHHWSEEDSHNLPVIS